MAPDRLWAGLGLSCAGASACLLLQAAAVSPRDALANGSSLAEAHQEELWQPPSTQQPEEGSAALCALSLADSLADAAGQESLESAAAPASSPRHRRPPTPVSPHALGALLELLQYCVGAAALPLPELAAGAEAGSPVAGPNGAQRGAGSAHKQSGQQGAGCGSDGEGVAAGEQAEGAACQRAPQLQWYDARARVALKQVAAWLQVGRSQALGRAQLGMAGATSTTCQLLAGLEL